MRRDRKIVKKGQFPISLYYWDNGQTETIIFAGGSFADKEKMAPLAEKLDEMQLPYNFVTFSYRGVEEEQYQPLKQQVYDLMDVFSWVLDNLSNDIILISTSMGAYSVGLLLRRKTLARYVRRAIFIDPADYYLSKDHLVDGGGTWEGFDKFKPTGETVSSLMREISSDTIVDVIRFTIRNFTENGYVSPSKRHIDNPNLLPRLNNKMVKNFYIQTPDKNKGLYIENNKLPHAFVRDGDVRNNIEILAQELKQIL